jgi:hypothetical protein
MAKRIARQKKRKQEKSKQKSRRNVLVILCSLLILTFVVGAMAQWKVLSGSTRMAVMPQSGAGSFNANSPSKEYIYAGGRLIATEEAGSASAPPAPAGFLAESQYLPTKVHLRWDAPAGSFDHYQVERKQAGTDFTTVNSNLTSSATSFDDSQVESNKAYLYRICAVTGSQSACSEPDLTTTVELQDYPFVMESLPFIRAQHYLDLMVAVNAVRKLAGPTYPHITWSTQNPAPTPGGAMYASHFNDLRNGLEGGLTTLGLSGTRYALPAQATKGDPITAAPMRKLQEIVR